MSTPQTSPSPNPTLNVYVDKQGQRMILNWTRQMPDNGFLGEVTYLSFVKKPIQVFAAKVDQQGNKTWEFQAQDGSFLCSMKVTFDQRVVTFLNLRKGKFPLVTVTTQFQIGNPTQDLYEDIRERPMEFKWTKPMPENGFLGEVTYRSFVNTPIQVFAAKVDQLGNKTWEFQAQNGTFLCSMTVTLDQSSITFSNLRKGQFPLVTVKVP